MRRGLAARRRGEEAELEEAPPPAPVRPREALGQGQAPSHAAVKPQPLGDLHRLPDPAFRGAAGRASIRGDGGDRVNERGSARIALGQPERTGRRDVRSGGGRPDGAAAVLG